MPLARSLVGVGFGLVLAMLSGCGRASPPIASAAVGSEPGKPSAADSGEALDLALPEAGLSLHLGPREMLVRPGQFGLNYFPDMATIVLERTPLRALVTAGTKTMLVEGFDWRHLRSVREVLSPGGPGQFDNGYTGITGLYPHADGTWYAIYYAEDHEGMPPLPGGIPGFYASQGLAASKDQGNTWKKLGQAISSCKPKDWTRFDGQADRGAGESGTVVTPDGQWLYVYYTEHSRVNDRGVQICLARSRVGDVAPSPTSFFKYHEGGFGQPGLGGQDTPVLSAHSDDQAEAMYPHVVYLPAVQKYVMILSVNYWKEYVNKTGLSKSGIYIAFSEDGIRWSTPHRLLVDNAVPLEGQTLSWEATLVPEREDALEGWLLYAYSPRWGHIATDNVPHYLVGRRARFEPLPADKATPTDGKPQ
jgi:hypothetical protein